MTGDDWTEIGSADGTKPDASWQFRDNGRQTTERAVRPESEEGFLFCDARWDDAFGSWTGNLGVCCS